MDVSRHIYAFALGDNNVAKVVIVSVCVKGQALRFAVKSAIKRIQSQACLGFVEREQIIQISTPTGSI